MVARLRNLRNRGIAARLGLLGAIMLVAFAVAAPVASRLGGPIALAAAATAAGLCLFGTGVALILTDRFRTPHGALTALWIGTALRTGVPFAAGMAIHLHGGPLARAGLLWYLLTFYPIALTVGTILSLPPTNRRPTPAR
ncbi:MAG: hypothetical protein WCB27_18245 [Thermoguttaceae bacterium]